MKRTTVLNFFKNHKTIFLFCLLFALIALVYGKSVKYDFTYFDDDALIFKNYDLISDHKNLYRIFYRSAFNSADDIFYRPVLTLSFAFDAILFGKKPFGYHLSNVLFHIISTFLILLLMKKLKFDGVFVFFLTALFAAHPAFAHAVVWIPGRNDVLLAIFVLSALIFLSEYFNDGRRDKRYFVLFFLMFSAALFVKESSVVMFAIVPLYMFLFCENVNKKDIRFISAGLICIALLYVLLRMHALKNADYEDMITVSGFIHKIPVFAQAVFGYIEYAVVPFRIMLYPEKIPFDYATAAAFVIFLIPLAASLFFKTGRKKVILSGLFWFFAFLIPSFVSSDAWFAHRLYVPAIGIIIMYAEFFNAVTEKVPLLKKYIAVLLLIAAVLFSFTAALQTKKFQNRKIFILNAIGEAPDSEMLLLKSAEYYAYAGMPKEAEKAIGKIKTDNIRNIVRYCETLAYVYCMQDKFTQAIAVYKQLLAIRPYNEASLYNMSEIYFDMGEYGEALNYAEKLSKMFPENIEYGERFERISFMSGSGGRRTDPI